MAISHENEKLADIYIKSAESSTLPLDEQAAWTELINSCKIATNGLTQAEKIQKMSENTLKMVGRMLYDRIQTVKVNQEFRNLNGRITDEISNINKQFSQKLDKITDSYDNLEKKMDERFTAMEKKITLLAEHLMQNNKDTYVLVGKESKEKELAEAKSDKNWLKTLLDGINGLKWAIVTLGGIITIAVAFKPQIGDFFEHIFGLFFSH